MHPPNLPECSPTVDIARSSASSDSAWSRGGSPMRGDSPEGTSFLAPPPRLGVAGLTTTLSASSVGVAPPCVATLAAADLGARRSAALGANVATVDGPDGHPLNLVSAAGCWVRDAGGRALLDAQSNVITLGHSHPALSDAVAGAFSTLNSNVRLDPGPAVAHAEALRALLPSLDDTVVFHTASGSEANDLAARIAEAATGRAAVAVLAGAYHGHAGAAATMSPHYNFGAAPGDPPPPHVHVLPVPDAVRGVSVDPVAAARAALAAAGGAVGAFVFEAFPSCAGQIVLPNGWLAAVCDVFRAAGAVIVADEVQTGLYRCSADLPFAFQLHAVTPDAVTLGKGLAGGYPCGAVAVSRAVAAPFSARGRFFSTFGGSSAQALAGLAVLRVLAEEGLPARAAAVGERLLGALRGALVHQCVGAVRGRGLMLGVELVRPGTLAPAPEAAAWAAATARARGVLISADGFPAACVLKIKPPLCFSDADAAVLVDVLVGVLDDMPRELWAA